MEKEPYTADRTGARVSGRLFLVVICLWIVVSPATAALMTAQQEEPETATVSIDAPESAKPGDTITASMSVTNTGNKTSGYILAVFAPESWEIVNRTDDAGVWKNGKNKWIWLSIGSGETRQPTLTFTVPEDATQRPARISVIVKSNNGVNNSGVSDTATHKVSIRSPTTNVDSTAGTTTDGTTTDGSGPGFGISAGIAALVTVALLSRWN